VSLFPHSGMKSICSIFYFFEKSTPDPCSTFLSFWKFTSHLWSTFQFLRKNTTQTDGAWLDIKEGLAWSHLLFTFIFDNNQDICMILRQMFRGDIPENFIINPKVLMRDSIPQAIHFFPWNMGVFSFLGTFLLASPIISKFLITASTVLWSHLKFWKSSP
jgi:hypothetical protein